MSLWVDNRSKVGQFWLNILDSMKRKQVSYTNKQLINKQTNKQTNKHDYNQYTLIFSFYSQ